VTGARNKLLLFHKQMWQPDGIVSSLSGLSLYKTWKYKGDLENGVKKIFFLFPLSRRLSFFTILRSLDCIFRIIQT